MAESAAPAPVVPTVHDSAKPVCDFTGAERAQVFPVNHATPPLSFAVAPTRDALDAFASALAAWHAAEGHIAFSAVHDAIPTFFDARREWTVRRGNGDADGGWRVARNWRTNHAMNYFKRVRGEPWWRVALEKAADGRVSIRWCFVHELRELNPGALPDDVWDMLPEFLPLPAAGEPPSDAFLERYAAQAWDLVAPSEKALAEWAIE